MLSVHNDKKSIKQQHFNKNKKKNTTKKPVKVVYISNPMKVKTSASEFSALVQELTGQDADVPDASIFSPEFEGGDIYHTQQQEDTTAATTTTTAFKVVADHVAEEPKVYPSTYDQYQEGYTNNNIETFHMFDNVEMSSHQMLESNFPGFENSNLWYDDEMLRK